MLNKKIRVLGEGLFLILALLLGSFTIGSLLALGGNVLPAEELDRLRWQSTNFFLAFLLVFLLLFHHLLNHILTPLEKLPGYLKSIAAEENPMTKGGIFPGSDVITAEANNLARVMSQCQLEKVQEKHKLSLIMDNMDNGVALVDEEGALLEGNKSFLSMFELGQTAHYQEADVFHDIQFSQFLSERLAKNQTGSFLLRPNLSGGTKSFAGFWGTFISGLS
ncbi:MAG: PAS domain-containing protein [Acidaminococcaceae bacterium]|nr:PAS domain-containing protein [Acidaminococcaceae bacterium]